MSRQYGQTGRTKPLVLLSLKTSMVILLVGLVVAVIGWFVLPIVIPIILPKYTMGIPSAQWASFIVLLSTFTIAESIFNVLKKQQYFICAALFQVLVFALSWMWLSNGATSDKLLVVAMQANLIGIGARSILSLGFVFWISYRHDYLLDSKTS